MKTKEEFQEMVEATDPDRKENQGMTMVQHGYGAVSMKPKWVRGVQENAFIFRAEAIKARAILERIQAIVKRRRYGEVFTEDAWEIVRDEIDKFPA